MTPEEINKAIAEHCGWKLHISDYCGDLNAMAQAESTLTEAENAVYAASLCAMLDESVVDWGFCEGEINWPSIASLISATAAQRAEAFLRTVGKWQSTPETGKDL